MTELTPNINSYVIGIVGATGAVGVELIKCLYSRSFPVKNLLLFSSAKSSGKVVESEFGHIIVQEYTLEKVRECDYVFLAVSGDFAQQNAKLIAADQGPIVIDNSSAFRYDLDIPLVIPEINPHTAKGAKLIANPNCTTAIAAVVLHPLIREFGIKKLIMSTYQAASGAGAEGMSELIDGTKASLAGDDPPSSVFAHPLAFNLIPQIDQVQVSGYTKEEMKVVWETLKIFELDPEVVRLSCTAVRVPVLRAHSEAISLETERPVTAASARELLSAAPGVRVVDDPAGQRYPMPLTASHSADVEVGRIRESLVFAPCGLDLFVCGDQLLRGAALNAVLIAELLVRQQQQDAAQGQR